MHKYEENLWKNAINLESVVVFVFKQPYDIKKCVYQDLLRRELDTRFMASVDRSIAIPPPPYMRSVFQPGEHVRLNGSSTRLTPDLSGPLAVPPNTTAASHSVRQFFFPNPMFPVYLACSSQTCSTIFSN